MAITLERFYDEYIILRNSGLNHQAAISYFEFMNTQSLKALEQCIKDRIPERVGTYVGIVDEHERRQITCDEITETGQVGDNMKLDYSKIEDVTVDGIDTRDYPDFCDAFISSATYDGRDMTDEELDALNQDYDYVYARVMDKLY